MNRPNFSTLLSVIVSSWGVTSLTGVAVAVVAVVTAASPSIWGPTLRRNVRVTPRAATPAENIFLVQFRDEMLFFFLRLSPSQSSSDPPSEKEVV